MNRVIGYSLSVYRRYKVYPIVLIFAIKVFSSVEVEEGFVVADKKTVSKIESKFLAQKCFLVSSNSMLEHIDEFPMDSMDLMTTMGYLLISNAVSLTSLKYQSDPTVHLIFQLSKNLIMKESDPKNTFTESVKPLLENIKRRIEDDVNADEIPGAIAKKIKGYINESFALINEQNNIMTKSTKAAESRKTYINENKYTKDDILFIETKSKPGKNRKWRRVYDEGKAQELFLSYSSSHNLKTSYYHLQKRME